MGWPSVGGIPNPVKIVTDAADEVVETVDDAIDTTSDVASNVYDGVSSFVDSPSSPIPGLFDGLSDLHSDALDLAENAADTSISLANDGYQLAGDVARAGPNAALDLADGLLSGADQVVPEGGLVDRLLNGAQDGVDAGQDALDLHNQVQETAGGIAEGVAHGVVGLGRQVAEDPVGTTQDIIEFARDTVDLLAIEENIEDLGPGDSYSLDASLDGSVYGIAGRLEGSQTITKNEDGSFTLAVTGQAGLGLMSRSGTTGAGTLTADAYANHSGTVEFTFDSAEETAEAARTFLGPVGGAVSGALDGGLDGALEGATPDYDSLLENISAVEISPSISGGILAEVGFGQRGGSSGTEESGASAEPKSILGISAGISGEASVGARIEFPDDGPPKLIVSQSIDVSVADSASIPGLKANLSGGASVTVEESFELPEGFSIGDAISDPLTAAQEIASSARRTGEVSVTLSGHVAGGVKSKGGELEAELRFTGGVDEVLDSGAIEDAVQGRFGKAFAALEEITEVEASLTPVTTDTTGVSYQGGDGVDSVGVSFSSTTVDRHDPILEYQGTLDEATDQLAAAIRQHRFSSVRG